MKYFIKVMELYSSLMILISKIMLILMVLIITIDVIARQIDKSILVANELALLGFTYFVIIGLVIGIREKAHINIELLGRYLPKRVKWINDKFIQIITLFIGIVLVYNGFDLIKNATNTLPATGWPYSIWYAVLPFAGVLCLYYSIIDIFGIKVEKYVKS
jgi:TRAP-type C4-dicarboxylate transport system permease small subunit